MRNPNTNDTDQPALQRDPDEWKTGDEPMTDAQRSYLETLCRETGEEFDEKLSKADASKRIDELRERSPRLAQELRNNDGEANSGEARIDRHRNRQALRAAQSVRTIQGV